MTTNTPDNNPSTWTKPMKDALAVLICAALFGLPFALYFLTMKA